MRFLSRSRSFFISGGQREVLFLDTFVFFLLLSPSRSIAVGSVLKHTLFWAAETLCRIHSHVLATAESAHPLYTSGVRYS